jgi:Putative Flp pilus-assembly TadE/G-like
MAQNKILVQGRRGERGQTIVLVAISILSLLAMASLAVDLVTLYVAKGEIQRAADAAALAGAKAFVDSGLTTNTPPSAALQTLATTMATQYINTSLPNNLVAGVAPTLVTSSPQIFNNSGYGNPSITVTLTQTNLPTFFARIWGVRFASVSATASAEAYNPSNWQTTTGVSVAPMCVKPLLVSNMDKKQGGSPFVDPATGAVEANVLGEPIALTANCGVGPCSTFTPSAGTYFPAVVSGASSFCPNPASSSSCNSLAGTYQQSVQCCDSTVYACGGGIPNATVDTTTSGIPTATQAGLQCAIHASNNGLLQGQDAIDVSNFTSSSGPMQITPATEPSGLAAGSLVNTSNSIMTFPIFVPLVGKHVIVVGFLQIFVNQSGSPADFDGYIVNVVGCSDTNPSGTVSGGGISPVPVRLITPP